MLPEFPCLRPVLASLLLGLAVAAHVRADDAVPEAVPVAVKSVPESIDDLRTIQKQVRHVLDTVMASVVNVRVGAGQGSGVIISADGYVLTAGHVSGRAERDVTVTLQSGRQVKGKTLGADRDVDCGLIQITDPGPWPFVPMGKSTDLHKGQWCLTIGHPGGYRPGRPPVVRLGRVLESGDKFVRTDCALVGGDSGGPLFDLEGRVAGVHSRIGNSMNANIHVPVDSYRDSWDRLAKGEVWGGSSTGVNAPIPYLGFQADPDNAPCKIARVDAGSPAEKAGLLVDDVITSFDGKRVKDLEALRSLLNRRKPGEEVAVEVNRGDRTMVLKLTIGKKV